MPLRSTSHSSKTKPSPLRKLLIVVALVAGGDFGSLWLAHTIFKPTGPGGSHQFLIKGQASGPV